MTSDWNFLGRFSVFVLFTFILPACVPSVPTPLVQSSTPAPKDMGNRPPACTQTGQRWVSPKDNVPLVCVPAGEFVMGAAANDPNASSDEMPQHRVYLDAFWIDETEANNANFTRCVTDGVCHPRLYTPYSDGITSATHLDYYANPIYGNYPVILYDGDEAQTFCKWAGERLPSEAEWEKAARGTNGRTFPWGEGIDCGKASYLNVKRIRRRWMLAQLDRARTAR
jgi:eukaryotic-like serine/threonine-protein kinase